MLILNAVLFNNGTAFIFLRSVMANNIYGAILVNGGATGALDAIDGAGLADLDSAIVQTDGAIYFYSLDATSGAAESSPDIISPDSNPGTKRWILQNVNSGGYIKLHDSKASGTQGGTFTSGAWQKRTVTEDQDTGNNASVASSVITLEAGTYDCFITCPAHDVDTHQTRLRNTSDGTSTIMGSSEFSGASDITTTHSFVRGRFTITAQKTFEIQHQCLTTNATNGFGVGASFGENVIFTVAEFWKVV